MKRTSSTDLFLLIKSLDKGEKRNLRLMAKVVVRGGSKRYMELYEVMDGQDAPDEEALVARFGDQLPSLKHYLHGLILRCLSHFDTSPSATFAATREQARILMEKELFGQAEKLLDRAIEDARAHEWWAELSQLLSLKILLPVSSKRMAKLDKDGKRLQAYREAEEAAHRNHQLVRDLTALAAQIKQIVRLPAYAIGLPSRAALREKTLADPVMAQWNPDYPLKGHYICHKIVALLENDTYSPNWRQAVNQIHALVTAHPAVFDSIWLDWFPFVGQLVAVHAQERDFEAAEIGYQHLKTLVKLYGKFRFHYLSRLTWLHIHIAVCQGDPRLLITALEVEERGMEVYINKINLKEAAFIYFIFSFGYFMLGNPKLALPWINRANTLRADRNSVVMDFNLRKWNILVHYDLQNYRIVETEYQSLKRLMVKHNALSVSDRFFMRTVRKLLNQVEAEEADQDLYERLLGRYEVLLSAHSSADWSERGVHLWAWLRAKTDGRPPCVYTWYLQRSTSRPES
jgi:hypothetical protein